jgi:hypothetical protein
VTDLADRSAVELVADVRARKLGVRDVVAAQHRASFAPGLDEAARSRETIRLY